MNAQDILYTKILDLSEHFTKSQMSKMLKIFGKEARIVDLLYYIPSKYSRYEELETVSDLFIDSDIIIQLKIIKHIRPIFFGKRKTAYKIIAETKLKDSITLNFFQANKAYMDKFAINSVVKIKGKLKIFKGKFTISHPSLLLVSSNFLDIQDEKSFTITTKYRLTDGVLNSDIVKCVEIAIKLVKCDGGIKISNFLPDITESLIEDLENIHFPKDISLASKSINRFAFEEFLASYLAMYFARKNVGNVNGYIISNEEYLYSRVLDNFKFPLTNDQNCVLDEILNSFKSGSRDFRLLQGDVGSGKTIVAMLSSASVIESGYQAIILAPTTILASQHYELACDLFYGLNIEIGLITSKISVAKRRNIVKKFKTNEIKILVGTHALFNDEIISDKLGLIVIDEQHRFGVNQRVSLVEKGRNAHILMMSATPIPRTLVMGMYGDINFSSIKSKPSYQKPVKTSIISDAKYTDLINHIQLKINDGDRIYWVCPLIESDDLDSSVYTRYEDLKNFIDAENIAILHGKMKEDEQNDVIMDFKSGNKKILISTTVVEVGVNVPDATIIVIESPDKFGLSQLHQLRGRVGRGKKQSFCILYVNSDISDESLQKLDFIKNNLDGMEIAKYDMKIRGFGNILGTQQSGDMSYRIANLNRDFEVMERAIKFAKTYCTEDIISSNIEVLKLVNHVMKVFCNNEFEKYLKA